MPKSARSLLDIEGELTVNVLEFKQVTPKLGVLSFLKDRVRYDDMFSVPAAAMKVLVKKKAGVKIQAEIEVDSSDDLDQHPEVTKAKLL